MGKKSITFVITNYNKKKYVSKCIDSILIQIDSEDLIIIVDDCSTDGSELVINKYLNHNNILFIKNKENKGVSYSRNLGINHSKTDLITFVDSDDTVSFGYVRDIKSRFINNIKCLCYGFNYIDAISNLNYKKNPNINNDITNNIEKIIFLENFGLFASSCNKVYSLEYIKKNKIKFNVNSKIMEDYEFNIRYFENIDDFIIVNNSFYNYYYFGDVSASSKYKPNLLNRYYELRDLRRDFYDKYKYSDVATKYNIEFLKICINNLYKSNGILNRAERIRYLKEIIELEEFKIWKNLPCKNILDKLLKVAFFINNVIIIDFNMNILHFVKNNSTFAHDYFKKKNKKIMKG